MMWWCCNRLLGRPLFPVCLDVWAPQGSALFPHSSPILMRHVTNDVFTSNQTHRLPLKLQRNETNETNKQIIKQNWSLPLFLWIKPPPHTHTHTKTEPDNLLSWNASVSSLEKPKSAGKWSDYRRRPLGTRYCNIHAYHVGKSFPIRRSCLIYTSQIQKYIEISKLPWKRPNEGLPRITECHSSPLPPPKKMAEIQRRAQKRKKERKKEWKREKRNVCLRANRRIQFNASVDESNINRIEWRKWNSLHRHSKWRKENVIGTNHG